MPITTQDIQLYQPEVLDDTDNGGGRMSPNQVIDGELNNLFDDQSRFDRVTGRVSLRKGWMACINQDRTKLLGSHSILLAPASDPNVYISMYGRDDHTDRRDDAQMHLEQYLAAGPSTPYYAWDTQPEGALQIVLLTNTANAPPVAGDVLVLSVEAGTVNLGQQQFVRCTDVASSTVTANVGGSEALVLQRIQITIDQPLRFDVPGEIFGYVEKDNDPQSTKIRQTTLAAGKRYYSIHPLTLAATAGDLNVQIESPLTPVVPSASQETALADQQVGSDTTALVAIGAADASGVLVQRAFGAVSSNAVAVLSTYAIAPGSVTVRVATSSSASELHVLTDDGRGALMRDASSGSAVPAGVGGTVDYRNGQIIVTGMLPASGTLHSVSNIEYRPAVAITDVQHTDGIEVTDQNRGLVYARTLLPKPQAGSLRVAYRALGRWITLTDRGDGTLGGASGEGTGTINYATGTLSITLGAEPDVGSYVLMGWGSGVHYRVPDAQVQASSPEMLIQLAEVPVKPSSIVLTYATYTATDDGAGNLTGDATGTVDYATGEIRATLTQVPASGTAVDVDYETAGNRATETPAAGGSGNTLEYQLTQANVDPYSVTVTGTVSVVIYGTVYSVSVDFIDDGAGVLRPRADYLIHDSGSTRYYVLKAVAWGTVNYTTGLVSVDEDTAAAVGHHVFNAGTWGAVANFLATFGPLSEIRYSSAGTPQAQSDAATLTALTLQIEDLAYGIVGGSLWLEYNTRHYYDRSALVYYRDSSGNEQLAGSIDYTVGTITLSSWAAGASSSALYGLLVAYGRAPLTDVIWRVPVERVKPGSFQLVYTREGQTLPDSATADSGGVITGAQLTGQIDYDTGVYLLTWAEPVQSETARYTVVGISFLPLDPEIIGLDPVRLPTDGRVPSVTKADVAVIHNTQTTTLPNPVIAGQSYATRPYISVLDLYDQTGLRIPTDRYTFDKATGDVTMANPLDLDGYTQPLVAHHRIEDMLLVTDVQLSGVIGFNSALTHDYPADTSYLSTALPLGNELQASAYGIFSQDTWTGVWSDELIGSPAVGAYNAVAFPIETTNRGAIRERWRIDFVGVTAFRIIGETVGQVDTGDTGLDSAPINPATGAPYFTLPAGGWSAGWSVGDQLRFNTEAAARPIWFNRCTLPGPLVDPVDQFRVELRGDAN